MATGELARTIQQQIVTAMKARDKERLGVLRMLQAAIKQVEIDERVELDEAGVLKVVSAYARKVKDQLASVQGTGRSDLAARAEQELAIVGEFLPAELPDAELEQLVRDAIVETEAASPKDLGRVIKTVLPRVAGRADGARISALVKRLLQS